MRFDTRGYCPFWTTDNWAMGYCRFDHNECHASVGGRYSDPSYSHCKKYEALLKISEKFKLEIGQLCLFREGENVR